MRSPHHFIVTPLGGRRYDNIRKYGEVDFIISSDQEDHTVTNRFAEVLATPNSYKGEISKGDVVVVHHNVFRKYYDMKGRERDSFSYFRDSIYLIDEVQFYLYQKDGKWKAPSPYCFVKPIENDDYNIFTANLENHKNLDLIGEIRYINQELASANIKEGDVISFTPESEYEFKINGETLYRMMTHNICVKM
tara:strand:+ start:5016 stop:5591 length:576 start_codon:yes stop_codon:yes gene_type:complete